VTTLRDGLNGFRGRASIDDLVKMASFIKVVPTTALGWLSGDAEPKGETLVRLQHFLHLSGWELDELKALPEPAYKLGQLIALDFIGVEWAVMHLQYANPTALYRVLQGGGLLNDRIEKIEKIVSEFEEKRQATVANFVTMRQEEQVKVETPEPAISQSSMATSVRSASLDDELSPSVLAVLLANSIVSTELLLEAIDEDSVSILAQVRALTGDGRINTLTEQLLKLLD
jgi:hypothetical protein